MLEQLNQQIKDALKQKQTSKLEALRMIKAQMMNLKIELGHEPDEKEALSLLTKLKKRAAESIDQFQKAGRTDLLQKEKEQVEVIESFLPKPLSDEELNQIIEKAIQTTNAKSAKDMGLVIKEIKGPTQGRVDGKKLADTVRSKLMALG